MPGPLPDTESQNNHDKRPIVESDGIMPTAPTWLDATAKKIFRDAAKKAVALGIASSADTNSLAIYALQNQRLQELSAKKNRDIREDRLLNDYVSSVMGLAKELGLSPGGRARMRIKPADVVDTESFFDEIKH